MVIWSVRCLLQQRMQQLEGDGGASWLPNAIVEIKVSIGFAYCSYCIYSLGVKPSVILWGIDDAGSSHRSCPRLGFA